MSSSQSTPILVTAQWLAENLPAVKVFDATSHLPTLGRNANEEHLQRRIAGAGRFDIDRIADKSSSLPHTLPDARFFAEQMQALGVNDGDHVVVYCDSIFLSAARAWWMLRLFGHERVSVLDGGLKAWQAINGPMDGGAPATPSGPGNFSVRPSVGAQAIPMASLRHLVENGVAGQIADARSPGRFAGVDPEPRKGLRGGHIPGSSNVPIASLIAENGQVRSLDEIRAAFTAGGIQVDRPVITSCGSGVTACGLALGLALLGNESVFVFDGSWTEWGGSDAPVETG
jgi:thiosulfate/3-mercaptopyruvate sulfurtransferase